MTHLLRPTARRAWTVFGLLHLATALLLVLDRSPGDTSALWGFPLDDAWIHLVYAKNVALLDGFAYNPGTPEAGFTSPLWIVLLAPVVGAAELLGVSPVVWVKLLGVATGVVTSGGIYHLVDRLGRDGVLPGGVAAWAGLAGGTLVALDPTLTFASVAGMEVLLASACLVWALERLASGSLPGTGVLLGLAYLSRPESATAGVVVAVGLALLLVREGASGRRWLTVFAPPVLFATAWAAWCLSVTGRPLPNTFYAKTGMAGGLSENLSTLATMLSESTWFTLGGGAAFLAVGGWRLARRLASARASSPASAPEGEGVAAPVAAVLLFAVPVAYLAGVAVANPLRDWWPFLWLRYALPPLPLLLAMVGVGLAVTWRWATASTAGTTRPGGTGRKAVVAALTFLLLADLPGALRTRSDLYAWNARNIQEKQAALGLWLRENTPPGSWFALHDAGALRWFSERPALDLMGLNDHGVSRVGWTTRLETVRPPYAVIFPGTSPPIARAPISRPVRRAVSEVYTICACDHHREMVVYELDWEAGGAPPSGDAPVR